MSQQPGWPPAGQQFAPPAYQPQAPQQPQPQPNYGAAQQPQQFAPPAQAPITDMSAIDALLSGGAKSLSFKDAADQHVWKGGVITAPPTASQQTDFATKQPKFYPGSGNPMMQVVVKVQTTERDPSNPADTGIRSLFIKSGLHTAVGAALSAAGVPGLRVGGTLMVMWVGEQPSGKGNPTKTFQAHYAPPADDVPAQAQPQLQQAPPAPQPQYAPPAQAPQQYAPQQPQQAAPPWPPAPQQQQQANPYA
jgi:hypothetical protein